jgi:hypothetical protein
MQAPWRAENLSKMVLVNESEIANIVQVKLRTTYQLFGVLDIKQDRTGK